MIGNKKEFLDNREAAYNITTANGVTFNEYKTLEEMAELSKEILNFYTHNEKFNQDDLLDEVADVMICLHTLIRLTKISSEDWYSIMNKKFKKIIDNHGDKRRIDTGVAI